MLLENTKAASTAMERLATGSKINTAQDDVASAWLEYGVEKR